MKAKLIKTEINYLLENEEGVIIASTSIKKGISSLSKQNCDDIFGVVDDDEDVAEDEKINFDYDFVILDKEDDCLVYFIKKLQKD